MTPIPQDCKAEKPALTGAQQNTYNNQSVLVTLLAASACVVFVHGVLR